jgi:hypothetical protein
LGLRRRVIGNYALFVGVSLFSTLQRSIAGLQRVVAVCTGAGVLVGQRMERELAAMRRQAVKHPGLPATNRPSPPEAAP